MRIDELAAGLLREAAVLRPQTLERTLESGMNESMQNCIETCWSCRDTCQTTLFGHCLQAGGAHVGADHVRLMTDCIQICQAAADFMRRGSAMHAWVCGACAAVCRACATSCRDLGGDHMLRCAEACDACAAECEKMAA